MTNRDNPPLAPDAPQAPGTPGLDGPDVEEPAVRREAPEAEDVQEDAGAVEPPD